MAVSRRGLGWDRQKNAEHGASLRAVAHFHPAIVVFHDAVADREPKPAAFACVLRGEERIEDASAIRDRNADNPVRIWIVGCSTGEEAYSLAMLFRERIEAAKRDILLQVFASDIDPDAVIGARDGIYPDTISADVSQARLARFFVREKECGRHHCLRLKSFLYFNDQQF